MIFYLHDVLDSLDELDRLSARITKTQFQEITKILAQNFIWIDFDLYLEKLRRNELLEGEVALSFDDGHSSLYKNVWPEILKLGKKCAFSIPVLPFEQVFEGLLPHQWVEACFRNCEKLNQQDYRSTKKKLKKLARNQGAKVYHNWLEGLLIKEDEVLRQALIDERFKFMGESEVQKLSETQVIIHHGYSHLPLGDATCQEVVKDQLNGHQKFNSNYYALPYGDLEGDLPHEFDIFEFVFGTEGPYFESKKPIVRRYNAVSLLNNNSK